MSDTWRLACFVDVETTGLDPRRDEVVELACVLFAFDGRTGEILTIVDQYTGLRQPSFPIPPEATRIHGITDADVRDHDLDPGRAHRAASDAAAAVTLLAMRDHQGRPYFQELLQGALELAD